MIRRYFLLLSLGLWMLPASGQTPAERMRAANDAFLSKQYEAAVERYDDLLADGYVSAALHYNLGNSHYRLNHLGPAILHYEKALLYRPHDRDIRHNLSIAREQLQDDLDVLPEFFLLRWWRGAAFALPTTLWSIAGLVLLWASIGGLIIWLLAKERRRKKQGFVGGLLLLLLCILPFALASSRLRFQQNSGLAILMASETVLRSAPDVESAEVRAIHEGLKVELLDQISSWYKVRLQDGEEGWLPAETLERI